MSEILAPLEQLPQTTRGLMIGTLRAASATLSASERAAETFRSTSSSMVAVRRTALRLNFLIARDGEEVLFFFVKRRLPTVRALSAKIHVVIDASPPLSPQERNAAERAAELPNQSAERTSYRLRVPRFLWARPSPAELGSYAPPGTTRQSGVMFRLGPNATQVLALNHPQDARRTTVSFQSIGQHAIPAPNRASKPFLLLAAALRDWLQSTSAPATELSLSLPDNPAVQTDVQVTLHWLIESYLEMERAAPRDRLSDSQRRGLSPRYLVSRYDAEIAVCVDHNGQFATVKSRDTVDIGMRLSVRREHARLVAAIDLLPPDFLCAGTLRSSFLQSLEMQFQKEPPKLPSLESASDWATFFSTANAQAIVFRTNKQGEQDREIFILPGNIDGKERTLMVRCAARVDTKRTPEKVELSECSVCYDSWAIESPLLDEETALYFFRLSTALRDWLQLLS